MKISRSETIESTLRKIQKLMAIDLSQNVTYEIECPFQSGFVGSSEYIALSHLEKLKIIHIGNLYPGLSMNQTNFLYNAIWSFEITIDQKRFEDYWIGLELSGTPKIMSAETTVGKGRFIKFNGKNGDLAAGDRIIGNMLPGSAEYFFIDILYRNFDIPVSHKQIFDYCEKQLKKSWQSSMQTFSNKMKNSIKMKCGDLIDSMIISTKTPDGENAYRLTDSNYKILENKGRISEE